MFEAHSLNVTELFPEQITLPCKRFNRTHKTSLKPISIWFSEGKRKARDQVVERCIFVYSEYWDDQGNNCFNCQAYHYPEYLTQRDLDRYIDLATQQELHKSLEN
ncbi:hypothetical protein [Neptuniibacter sp.]|uniref:hypothetical protein n=1 Tax=Neptuniibacter sp. TaxID=1962643 RepID=UPI003B5C4391